MSAALRRVGFFRELPHGDPDGPSLDEACRPSASDVEASALRYLRAGEPYVRSPGVVFDVRDGSGPVGTGTIRTDGQWIWPDDLAHYVERYHVELPDEFSARVRAAGADTPGERREG